MKILNWNLERPKINQKDKIRFIQNIIFEENPDIIFLTETNLILDFGKEYFSIHSKKLPKLHNKQEYSEQENRISIFSKYPFIELKNTYDDYTAICGKINTEFGEIFLYGSIIGSFGGRDLYFENDLKNQKIEIQNLEKNICFAGDFNISFSGWKYPSKKVVEETKEFFKENNLKILTENNVHSAMHVVMSKNILKNKILTNKTIEIDKKISDHNIAICEIISINN